MARLLTAGFETGSLQELNGAYSAHVEVVSDQVRTGGFALRMYMATGVAADFAVHTFPSNVDEIYTRFALRIGSAGIADGLFFSVRDDGGATQLSLAFDAATQTLSWIDGAGSVLAAGTIVLRVNIWYVIETHIKIDPSAGELVCKINAVTDASFSGDTQYTASAYMRSGVFRGVTPVPPGASYVYFDDIAINDTSGSYQNSWIGLGGIFLLKPTGDGAETDFTPSAGSDHYALVDDVPANSTDWVQGGTTPGDRELFAVEDAPDYITDIALVEVVWQAAVAESGSNELAGVVRQGATNYADAAGQTVVSISPDWVLYKGETLYVQPVDSSAWDDTAVDALQVGVEIT